MSMYDNENEEYEEVVDDEELDEEDIVDDDDDYEDDEDDAPPLLYSEDEPLEPEGGETVVDDDEDYDEEEDDVDIVDDDEDYEEEEVSEDDFEDAEGEVSEDDFEDTASLESDDSEEEAAEDAVESEEEVEDAEPGARVALTLDGSMKSRKKQAEELPEESTDEPADKKSKSKGKGKSKKKSAPPQSSLNFADKAEIESSEPLMTESYVGSSGVMHDNGVAKVCERSDGEVLMCEYVPIDRILVLKRIRVVIPDQKLKSSIAVNGLIEPIVVAPIKGDYEHFALVDGAKRLNACKELGFEQVPCVFGHAWKCKNLKYLEAVTNMQKGWGGAEHLAFANMCLDDGIRNEGMVESLCDMDEGEAHKAIDLVTDNDPAIVGAVAGGKFYRTEVSLGYKKLEARRKKEYEEGLASGEEGEDLEDFEGEGSFTGEITPFTAEINQDEFGEVNDTLGELNAEFEKGKAIDGFEAHKQKVGERECLDPSIRKAAMERSGGRCLCCRRGGESYVDCLDAHHIVPVYLGGEDSVDNTAILCITCHRMVHLYGTGDLHLDDTLQKNYSELNEAEKLDYPNEQIFLDERVKMRNIAKLGNLIREGAKAQKIKREELKKEHPVGNLGRRMPGKNGVQTEA